MLIDLQTPFACTQMTLLQDAEDAPVNAMKGLTYSSPVLR